MMNDNRGFAFLGSAIVMALAISIGFGAAVIVERNHYIHQVKLSQQRVNRKAHERLDLTATRNPDNTVITVTNAGSAPAAYDYLLLRQPDNRVVAGPTKWPDSLVGWWRFSEGVGDTAHDYSGNGHSGELKGNPQWVDGWVGDGAVRLDGNDYVALDMFYQDGDSLPNFTVSVQYKTSVSGESWTSNWSFLDFDRSEWFNVYIRGGNGKLSFSGSDGVNDYYDIYADTASNDGIGHEGAVVYSSDRDFVKFYLDGDSDGTKSYANVAPINDATTRYGFVGDGSEASSFNGDRNNRYFEGTIDEVVFFNRALSPGEISELGNYNVLIDPVGLKPLESYSITYPYRIGDDVTVGVITHLGKVFWEER